MILARPWAPPILSAVNAPAGWFLDPAGTSETYRWWDGQGWTRWLSHDSASAPPVAVPPAAPSEALAGRSVRIPLAVALVVGVVALALVAVGLTVVLTQDRIRTGPAVAPPSAAAPAGLLLDRSARTLGVENVRLVLPGPPYECDTEPRGMAPSFTSAISCAAPIHTDYADTDDWYASTGLGLIEDSLVAKGDLARTARSVFASLRRAYFRGQPTTVQKLTRVENAPGRDRGLFVAGEVHYAIRGLSSRYDRMLIGVLELPTGRHVAFFSVRPNDTPKSTLDVLNRSIATLSAG